MMGLSSASQLEDAPADGIHFGLLCDALPIAALLLDAEQNVCYANSRAEELFGTGAAGLVDHALHHILELDAHWQALLADAPAFHQGMKVTDLPFKPVGKAKTRRINVHLANCGPVFEHGGQGCMLLLEPRVVSEKLGHYASQQKATQSAAVMAHILAHEVRNPLSGIRGAAQFLKKDAGDEDAQMLELICHEVDRIGGLLNQVEYFSDDREIALEPVNIHEVLRYVRDIASHGMAAEIVIDEIYDPSLPLVRGNRELLIQAFLNLVKNAAEVLEEGTEKPVISIKTAYRSGFRMKPVKGKVAESLPVCVMIQDNGPGIDPSFANKIFDPFVTNKTGGRGLGLPVVAKVAADHGGVVMLEKTQPGETVFAMQLAMWQG